MNHEYIKGYCDGQGSRLQVLHEAGDLLFARVELPDGLMWSFGHTAIALTQQEGQSVEEFWFELLRGMNYPVVPEEIFEEDSSDLA